jgi:uncharacterized protein GlcG (DUF336 family)
LETLTLAQARQIIDGALARARAENFKPMGIAVLDEGGNLKAFAREDGASMFRFEIARGKAWGAVGASGGSGDEDELICAAGVESAGLKVG